MIPFSMNVLLFLTTILLFCPGSAAGFFTSRTTATRSQSYAVEYDQKAKQYKLQIKISIPEISTANIPAAVQPRSYAADAINLSIPVYNALQNPLSPNDSIDNILYANLRLKKVLDDYLAIQKRARQILNNEDFKPIATTSDFLEQQFSPQDQQLLNFSKKLSSINREFKGLVQQIHENISREQLPSASTVKKTKEINSINLATNTYLQNIIPNQYQQTSSVSPEYTPSKHQYEQTYNSEDITLPWIIRMPLNIFHYLMTNVIEAMIYGILLLIVISIISAARSPK